MQEVAEVHKSTAIVGVGLMPGLSNVIAFDIARQFDSIDRVEINLMLGLGDSHGLDAVKWMLRNISSTFSILRNGKEVEVKSFTDPYKTTLLNEKKARKFYRFDFSDQHTLTQTVHAKQISSRLAFDSRLITTSMGWLRKIGIFSFIKEKHARISHVLMDKFPFGSDQWALQVDAYGMKDKRQYSSKLLARGEKEGLATAIIATYVVRHLYENKVSPGVYPIEKVVTANAIYEYCQKNGIELIATPPFK